GRPQRDQSPFAQLGCYLRWGDVIRLLRGHYSSVFARTGSSAAPVGLSPSSAFGLVWRVLAGCCQSLLPTAASRRYLQQSVLGCWIPYPGGTPCALSCFFHDVVGLPQDTMGRLPASVPRITTSRRVVFRGCRYFVMFRPPSLLTPQIVPTAAILPQGTRGFYVRAYRTLLPPHAPDMLKCYSDQRRRGIGSNRSVSWGAPSVRLTATMVPHPRRRPHSICTVNYLSSALVSVVELSLK